MKKGTAKTATWTYVIENEINFAIKCQKYECQKHILKNFFQIKPYTKKAKELDLLIHIISSTDQDINKPFLQFHFKMLRYSRRRCLNHYK